MKAADRRRQGAVVARGHDEPVAPVAEEASGDGPDGVGRDDWQSVVHGFVDDHPPRLAEGPRANRRYDHNVRARVEVADLRRAGLPGEAVPRRARSRSFRTAAHQDQRGCGRLEACHPPGREKHPYALFPQQAAGKQDLERRPAAPLRARSAPEVGVHGLRRVMDPRRAPRLHIRRDVRPVGGDRVGVRVDPAQGRIAEHAGRPGGLGPERRPQHERHARPPRPR